jgi:hypothetical protein
MQFTIVTIVAAFALIQGSAACSSGCSSVTNTQNHRAVRSLALRANTPTPAEWPAKLSACFQGDGTAPAAKVTITGSNSADIAQLSGPCMSQVQTYSVADAMQFGTITPVSSTEVKVSNVPAAVFQHLQAAASPAPAAAN